LVAWSLFALELAQANKLLPSAREKFPTGAMASFRFDGAWKGLEPHGALLDSFIMPKAIAGVDPLASKGTRSLTAGISIYATAAATSLQASQAETVSSSNSMPLQVESVVATRLTERAKGRNAVTIPRSTN
jgi:hypothetical protein